MTTSFENPGWPRQNKTCDQRTCTARVIDPPTPEPPSPPVPEPEPLVGQRFLGIITSFGNVTESGTVTQPTQIDDLASIADKHWRLISKEGDTVRPKIQRDSTLRSVISTPSLYALYLRYRYSSFGGGMNPPVGDVAEVEVTQNGVSKTITIPPKPDLDNFESGNLTSIRPFHQRLENKSWNYVKVGEVTLTGESTSVRWVVTGPKTPASGQYVLEIDDIVVDLL